MKLLYFHKDDCPPCATFKPVAETIATELGLPLEYVKAVEPGLGLHALAVYHQVRATPTLVAVNDDGTKIAAFVGGLINLESVRKLKEVA